MSAALQRSPDRTMTTEPTREEVGIAALLALMAALRDPEHGCAWDRAQSFASIAPYTIEEAYEVADAIERGDAEDLRDELGDLLLQVVFHARIAQEAGLFAFGEVVEAIRSKLIRRHPHVFDATGAPVAGRCLDDVVDLEVAWERIKAEEQAQRAARRGRLPIPNQNNVEIKEYSADEWLGRIALALPALMRAEKVSRRAAGFGFDWPNTREVLAKVREEVAEVEESLAQVDPAAVAEEIGDLLFSVANLARHAGVDPEVALQAGTRKFERRFTAMAQRLTQDGSALATHDLAAMEAAWQAVKRAEKASSPEPTPDPAGADRAD